MLRLAGAYRVAALDFKLLRREFVEGDELRIAVITLSCRALRRLSRHAVKGCFGARRVAVHGPIAVI
ncbi:hypothetical protein AYM40_08635 [Paraburkholderia phytofirmans OLGA172]|uniref:Uncharacterized protein n=1 Tax=Paraburkholderia phytofirmans OLGA172 TaxID=1417228 RepID=A0A160FJ93_9BURK|nr:hypothetical protein AYM40_08635 [Paraburkholderia phytofirmans OLGA172]